MYVSMYITYRLTLTLTLTLTGAITAHLQISSLHYTSLALKLKNL